MPRIKEYDRTEVLDAATRIFWKKGFKGASVSDLVAATGLGKRSMYKEFGSKEGLFRECIDHYSFNISREATSILGQEPLGVDNIKTFFRNRIDYATSKECDGCMVVNSAVERELLDELAVAQVSGHLSATVDAFESCLKADQERGEIASDKDCRALAEFLFTFATGVMVMSRTEPSRESLEARVAVALSVLK